MLGASLTRSSTTSLPAKAGFVVAGDDPWRFIPSFPGASGNLAVLEAAAKGIGAINWLPDRDQIVRRVPLVYRIGNEPVPSLAAELLRVGQGASTFILKAFNASGETSFGRNTGLNHLKVGDIEIRPIVMGRFSSNFVGAIQQPTSRPGRYSPAKCQRQIWLGDLFYWNQRAGPSRFTCNPTQLCHSRGRNTCAGARAYSCGSLAGPARRRSGH